MLVCANCKGNCTRIRKTYCDICYTKFRIHGDPNYLLANFPNALTQQQNNIVVGSMLGDGHLTRRQKHWNTALVIKRKLADKPFLEWEANILSNLLTNAGITEIESFDERTDKTYYACSCRTRALTVLNSYYNDWYQEIKGKRTKVVPNHLQLNAEIIAIWFCDDGFIGIGSSNRFRMSFATNGFSKDEVHFLQELLNKRYNENFLVNCCRDTLTPQYQIVGSDSAVRTLIQDIDPIFPQGMDRKRLWDDPKSCYYSHAPKRRKSHKLSSEEKQSKIVKYLKNHDEFYLIDLGRFAGFDFKRKKLKNKNRKCKRKKLDIAVSNLKSIYLQKYIDQGFIADLGRQKENYKKGIKLQITAAGRTYFDSL